MQFIDLQRQRKHLGPILEKRLAAILEHGHFIMGPEVVELEEALASRIEAAHCISCANGTDALAMALRARGIGPGDAVITTSFSFIASADVIAMTGATPVFVDIEPDTYNMDPVHLSKVLRELAETGGIAGTAIMDVRPAAMIVVDLFGQAADFEQIIPLAEEHGVALIEDAAQGFGGRSPRGACANLAPLGTTSFFPAKPLGCYGDGGAVFTNDSDLAAVLDSMRLHGKGSHKYENVRLGFNSRLDTIQAAILMAKLTVFDEEIRRRQEVASYYNEQLESLVKTPVVRSGYFSAWAQYTIEVDDRLSLSNHLQKARIPSAVYYPVPLHRQPVFASLSYAKGSLPVSERAADRVLCLPMHPYLTEKEQDCVVMAVRQWIEEKSQ